jgi:signal transduction histidine kinase
MKHVMRNVSGVAVGALAAWLTVSRRRDQHTHAGTGHAVATTSIVERRSPFLPDLALLNAELQSHLRDRANELAWATADLKSLEDFIQGEMRTGIAEIRTLAILLKHSEPREGVGYQGRVEALESASQRLDESAGALGSLAKLSRVELHHTDVDLTSIANGFLRQLQERDRRRVVVTHVQEGLHASGDRDLLRTALEVLLGNAWERTERSRLATITLIADVPPTGQPIYCVRDNGTPLDAPFAQILFDDLPHMQAKEDFRAPGIRLAAVRGIVRRHGGRVWIGASGEALSEVHFTLGPPALQQHA